MTKALTSALLSGALLLTVGTARSWANTISFSDSSTHLDGAATIPEMMPTGGPDSVSAFLPLEGYDNAGTCGPSGNAVYGCSGSIDAFDGPVSGDDFPYRGPGFWTGDVGTMPNVLMALDNVCDSAPIGCGESHAAIVDPETETVRGSSLPALDTPAANTDEVVTSFASDADAVPESGSLMLVGLGLLIGARYLRRRKIA